MTAWLRGSRRRAAVGVAAWVVVVIVAAVAYAQVRSEPAPTVTVLPAGPAVIEGEVGARAAVEPALDVPISLARLGVSNDVTMTAIHVAVGSSVAAGGALLDLDPAAVSSDISSITAVLQASEASLATALAATAAIPSTPELVDLAGLQAQTADRRQAASTTSGPDQTHKAEADLASAAAAEARAQDLLTEGDRAALVKYLGLQADIASLGVQVNLGQELLAIARGDQAPTLTSPFPGRVAGLGAVAGQTAAPGVTLVELTDATRLRVRMTVTGPAPGEIQPGERADLGFDTRGGITIQGTVISAEPSLAGDVGALAVVVDAPNTPDHAVNEGDQAAVRIHTRREAAVTIPVTGIAGSGARPAVFVVDGDRVRRRPVVLGRVGTDRAEVISGLAAGQAVVVSGTDRLVDGETVRIQ